MPEITVLTVAYNAEKTLRRTVDSVLAQSFHDFEYVLIDHGSTDCTRRIIEDYARRDSRVQGVYLDENGINQGDMSFTQRLQLQYFKQSRARWGVCLDADDRYEVDALQHMLAFAEQTGCDVVCCGSNFVFEETGKIFSKRITQSHALLREPKDWDSQFPAYHQFMRAYWAKLISLDILRSPDFTMESRRIMGDTGIMLAIFEAAETVGFLAEPLHTWYMSGGSTSQTMLTQSRIEFNLYCYTRALDFLRAKCGGISPRNREFLLIVFMNELIDSFRVLPGADISQTEKLQLLQAMFLNAHTRELAAYQDFGALLGDASGSCARRKNLFDSVANWMLSLEEVPDEEAEDYCTLGTFVSAAAENGGAWITFQKLLAQFLEEQGRVDEAGEAFQNLAELLPDDEEIQAMAKKHKIQRHRKKPEAPNQEEALNQENVCTPAARRGISTGCDKEFYALIEQLKTESIDQLLSSAATWANRWVDENYEYYGLLLKWYRSWYNVGLFGQDQGFIQYFGGMYQYLKQNADRLVQLYEQLADNRSKLTLKIMLQHWMTFHPDLRESGRECQYEHYFDLDVMQCDENEVFVDCGCFDGGTVKDFIRCYGPRYKRIYSYELTPSTYEVAKRNLKDVERLCLRNAGVSDKNGQFRFWDSGNNAVEASNRLHPNGNAVANVVKIDDDIPEAVTFIKMDIEGAECEALYGAEKQIRRNRPKLAISLYHKLSDLLDIPQIVKSFVPEYKLYLRHYFEGKNEFPFPSEYVLLAVAEEERTEQEIEIGRNSRDREKQRVALVGLNQKTAVLWSHLEEQGYDVEYVIDETGVNCGKQINVNGQAVKLSAPCISAEDYAALNDSRKSAMVIVADLGLSFRYPYAEPFYILKKAGICDNIFTVPDKFYTCPSEKPVHEWLFEVDMSRGVLDFLQLMVTFQCNLSCKGCTNIAEPVSDPLKLFSAEKYIAGLEQLSKYFWQISRFRFSGGEPLLHNELPRLVREVRRLFPYTEMAVITNALLLLNNKDKYAELLETCKQADCALAISSYKPVYKRKPEIECILGQYGVKYYWQGWQVPIEKWRTKRLLHPTGDPETQYAIAEDEQVNALLHDGYLYASGDAAIMQRIFERFGFDTTEMMQYMESARVKLSQLDRFCEWTDIVHWIKSPNDMCRYWGKTAPGADGYAWFDYQLIPPTNTRLGDYLMIDTTEEERTMRPLMP